MKEKGISSLKFCNHSIWERKSMGHHRKDKGEPRYRRTRVHHDTEKTRVHHATIVGNCELDHSHFVTHWLTMTRHQSTPLYLYIQNIILVCQSDTPCTRLDRENLQFPPNRILSQWSITLPFSNLDDQNFTRWGKLGINLPHSTCTFRISNWFVSLTHFV